MVLSDANFDCRIQEGPPVLVMFWQRDCQPCKALVPELIGAARERDQMQFIMMNATDNPQTKERFNITACPTMALFKNGDMLGRWMGVVPKEKILAWIDRTVNSGRAG